MKNSDDISTVLLEWLTGMVPVSVNYAAGFAVRLEREISKKGKPNVLHLTIRSSARFGSQEDWKSFLSLLPIKDRRGETGDSGLAYRLMLMLGSQIRDIELTFDGTLSLSTTDMEVLIIPGIEDVWEESWVLEELEEIAGDDAKSIVCDSSGEIHFG